MTNKFILICLVCVLPILFNSCDELDLQKEVPKCIEKKIKTIINEESWDPPASVWEWQADGYTYYYFTSACCDQYNYLYNSDCSLVCAPDGGFSGTGDGNCPDFGGQITKTLIWEDDSD